MNGSTSSSQDDNPATPGAEDSPSGRFTIVPHWIMKMLSGNSNEMLVYLCLAYHSDEFGYSRPSHATIAAETGLSVSTVQRALKSLVEREGFRKESRMDVTRGQIPNGYHVPITRVPPGHSDRPPRSQ